MGRLKKIAVMILLTGSLLPVYADDQDQVLQLRQSGEVMALEQILMISRQQQQGRILEVELEREGDDIIYELKILADDGQVWELKVDARNGNLVKKELD